MLYHRTLIVEIYKLGIQAHSFQVLSDFSVIYIKHICALCWVSKIKNKIMKTDWLWGEKFIQTMKTYKLSGDGTFL